MSLSDDNSLKALPDGTGDIKILGNHGINTLASIVNNSITIAINNAITLGDITPISAGNNALTIETGDLEIQSTNAVGNFKMPNTTSADSGVITFGGNRFIHDSSDSNTPGNSVFIGRSAGNTTTALTVTGNVGIGHLALTSVATSGNVAVGASALQNMTTGTINVGIGFNALNNLIGGIGNIAIGYLSMNASTAGTANIAIGGSALSAPGANSLAHNIAIGGSAGAAFTSNERDNIIIGNSVGQAGDHTTIRIGAKLGQPEDHTRCFIAGISGVTVANQEMVTIDTVTDQLGSQAIPLSGFTWSTLPDDNQIAQNGHGYFTAVGASVITLPITAAVGETFQIVRNTVSSISILQNAGQQIRIGNQITTAGVTGNVTSLGSEGPGAWITLVCSVANTEWIGYVNQGTVVLN